jgi:hypothetical protein
MIASRTGGGVWKGSVPIQIYIFALANLLSNTLLGLLDLTDRINRPNKVAQWATPPDAGE